MTTVYIGDWPFFLPKTPTGAAVPPCRAPVGPPTPAGAPPSARPSEATSLANAPGKGSG